MGIFLCAAVHHPGASVPHAAPCNANRCIKRCGLGRALRLLIVLRAMGRWRLVAVMAVVKRWLRETPQGAAQYRVCLRPPTVHKLYLSRKITTLAPFLRCANSPGSGAAHTHLAAVGRRRCRSSTPRRGRTRPENNALELSDMGAKKMLKIPFLVLERSKRVPTRCLLHKCVVN